MHASYYHQAHACIMVRGLSCTRGSWVHSALRDTWPLWYFYGYTAMCSLFLPMAKKTFLDCSFFCHQINPL